MTQFGAVLKSHIVTVETAKATRPPRTPRNIPLHLKGACARGPGSSPSASNLKGPLLVFYFEELFLQSRSRAPEPSKAFTGVKCYDYDLCRQLLGGWERERLATKKCIWLMPRSLCSATTGTRRGGEEAVPPSLPIRWLLLPVETWAQPR